MTTFALEGPATPRARATPLRIEPLESVFVVLALLWIMNTFGGVISSDLNRQGGSREASNALIEAINLSIYFAGLSLTIRAFPSWIFRVVVRAWPLLALVVLALMSTLWSDSPATTIRRAAGLTLTLCFCFYIVAHFRLERFLTLLFIASILYVGIGFLAVLVPGKGIASSGAQAGTWQGFTGFKNDFGRIVAVITTFLLLFKIADVPWWRRVWWVAVPPTLVLLIKSDSKTSLAVAFASILLTVFLRYLCQARWRWLTRIRIGADIRTISAILAIGAALVGFFFIVPSVAEALGRDMTLSGRTKLWAWAIGLNQDVWFGHGYRAFWIDDNTKYFFEYFAWNTNPDLGITGNNYAGPGNGHSGYVDTWLELGWIGVAFLVVFFLSAIKRIWSNFHAGSMTSAYALAGIVSFMLMYSVTERVILQQTEGAWFLTMLLYLFGDPVVAGFERSPGNERSKAYTQSDDTAAAPVR